MRFRNPGRRVERIGYLIGALLLASGLIHLGILVVGGGSWMGPLSLRKPMTFGLSFGLTLITITWVSSFLRRGDRARTVLLTVFAGACVLETALASLQAWRGVPSHFNVETPVDAVVPQMLAAGGATLVAILVLPALAWLLSRTAWSDRRQQRVIVVAATGYDPWSEEPGAFSILGASPMPRKPFELAGYSRSTQRMPPRMCC